MRYLHVNTITLAMSVWKARTFRSGNSEAVRLTKDIAFGPDVELTMVRSGDVLTIYPTRPSIQALIETWEALPKPDQVETRDDEELPKRTGL
jgi:antitoxin VapB